MDLTGALAGASAPELARLVKETTESNTAVNAVAHAVLGGVVAALQGNSATSGAAGAATGELVARAIADIYYPSVKMSNLTESQKQTISSLASVSSGIAGGHCRRATGRQYIFGGNGGECREECG